MSVRAALEHIHGCHGFIWFRSDHIMEDSSAAAKALHNLISSMIEMYDINSQGVYLWGYSQGMWFQPSNLRENVHLDLL